MAAGIGAYRQVLSDPRARAFSLAGLVARMPMSMTGLGTVLLISLETGSFGRAGLVAAFGTVSGAVVSPLTGRLIDRIGQARVLVAAALVNGLSLALLITTVELRWPLVTSLLAAIGVGLGFSSAGTAVRARWSHRLFGSPLLNTAFAVEAILDEVVFIVGPVLATFLATAVHPALGLVACVVLGVTGAFALAAQRSTQPPVVHVSRAERGPVERIPVRRLLPLALASVAIGCIFGGMEVVVVAFAKGAGVVQYAGLILLAWATGSLVAGLVVGLISWRAAPSRRFRLSAVALALSTVPLPFVHQPWLLTVVLVLSGLAIAPTMIASITVAQAAVPHSRLNEAFGWTSMGLATGVAIGAASLGRLIDHDGPQTGFWGVVAAGAVLIVLTLLVRGGADPVKPAEPDTPAAQSSPAEDRTPSR
jgi:MFS family permease